MLRLKACFSLILTALGSVACGAADDEASFEWPQDPPLELGTRHYIQQNGAGLVYEILEQPEDLLQQVQSDRFDGYGIVAVTASHDITAVDELAPEHVLRLSTRTDAETLSSRSGLRKGGGLGSPGTVSPVYKVWLLFEATVDRTAAPGSGVLELDPAGGTLSVEWEYPSTGDVERLDVELALPAAP